MTLDSNILIEYLNGDQAVIAAISKWKRESRVLFISTITAVEVLSLPAISPDDIMVAQNFLQNFITVPFDDKLVETAAFLRRTYKFRMPDAAIVATALVYQTPLVTRDQRLKKAKELTIIEL